jgi:hypothetical protein
MVGVSLVVISFGGGAAAATLTASPGKWASTFCGSFLTWERAIKQGDARMAKVLNGLQKSGHASLPNVRAQLVTFLSGVESGTGRLLGSLRTLGAPPGRNGGKLESGLIGGIERTQSALAGAVKEAKALPINNAKAFVRDTAVINKTVAGTFNQVASSFSTLKKYSSAALTAAVEATPACRKLG